MSGRRFDTLIDLAPEMTRKDPHQIAMNVLTTDTLNEQTVLVDDGCHVLKTIWEHQNRYECFWHKFDSFEIRVFIIPNLVTIYQRVLLLIAENKLDIGRQKLMSVD